MMDYKNASDFEINKEVAIELGLIISDDQASSLKAHSSSVLVNDMTNQREVNPCRNWSDAGALINTAAIEIKRDTCQAHVSSYFNPDFVIHCRNDSHEIRRAIAICFLMLE